MLDQSRAAAFSVVAIWASSMGRAASSSNRPPLNHSTSSNPTWPPVDIAPKSFRASAANCSGCRRACLSMRVNMSLGSRPTSSANMQNTSRFTKWATSCGSWPWSRSDCARRAKVRAARSVSVCLVSPGRSRSGSDIAHLSLSRTAASMRSSSSNSSVLLTELVQFVRIRNRLMSETINRGGFSRASAYCLS